MRMYWMACLIAAAALTGGYAQASQNSFAGQGLQKSYNWQQEWGAINFSGSPDPGIDSSNLQPKADIKRVVSLDGTQTSDLSGVNAYSVDLNSDGISDIITDASGYFTKYQKAKPPTTICTKADGCYISIYLFGENTTITSTSSSGETGVATTKYNTRTVYSEQVLGWNVMSAADFQVWATGKDYQLFNANPVFAALRNNTKCYQDEIAQNNNQCVKYSQYVGDFATGAFIDLYNYQDSATQPQYDTRFTYVPYDRSTAIEARGIVNGGGFGHKLGSGEVINIQIANMSYYHPNGTADAPAFHAYQITNGSNQTLFVPANSDKEFSSFLNAATGNHLPGVSVCAPPVKFTDWGGDQQCPTISTTTTTIASQRFCISATSDYRNCSECVKAARAVNGVGWPDDWALGCAKTQKCQANACYIDSSTATSAQFPRSLYWNSYTSEAECEAEQATLLAGFSNGTSTPNNVMPNKLPTNWLKGWPTAADLGSYPNNFWILDYYFAIQANGLASVQTGVPPLGPDNCKAAFSALCSMGHICLAGDSEISLPDGTTKRIDAIKAGDTVIGFAKTNGKLTSFKVDSVTTTPKQDLLKINGTLSVTPNHRVIVANGQQARASTLKVGDVLLAGDKSRVTIKTIETVPAQDTVYNLVLEKPGIGFVANGLRVMDYKR